MMVTMLPLGVGCVPTRGAAARAGRPQAFFAESLRSQFDTFAKPGERAPAGRTPNARPLAPGASASVAPVGPPFSYDLYCDAQGHFTYDGAALALLQRPEHLRRVYSDADTGQARAKQLVWELEHVFRRFGTWVADETTTPECLVLPDLVAKCLPRLGFLNELFGRSPEVQRLREVVAQQYEVRARERGAQNEIVLATLNFLLAMGMAKGMAGSALAGSAAKGAIPLSAFEASTIDAVITSSRAPAGEITQGARAIAKKLGHARSGGFTSAFQGLNPTQEAAEGVIRDVMHTPTRVFVGDKVVDVYGTAGMGVRFDKSTGCFIGFLEETLASQ